MPLKRIFASNPRKRLHQRAGSGLFSYAGGLWGRKPSSTPQRASNSSPEPPRNAATEAPEILPFCHSIPKILLLLPFLVSEIPDKTPTPLKEFFIFAPFQPILPPFAPVRSAPNSPAAPMLPANRERKPTRKEGTQQRKKGKAKKRSDKPTSPQKEGTPPYCKEQAAIPLITNSRQKISKKSPWVVLKKFSEKFFVGMFRGKEKPLALSQRKGRSYNKS